MHQVHVRGWVGAALAAGLFLLPASCLTWQRTSWDEWVPTAFYESIHRDSGALLKKYGEPLEPPSGSAFLRSGDTTTLSVWGAPQSLARMTEALDGLRDELKRRIKESGAEITASALPAVRGDTSQLSHVFQNLLSNALKYRKKDVAPKIDISCAREGDRSIVAVRDNGIGFEPRYAERIFGLFKRLHQDDVSGTGLGLAICQRIVERYGGKIWAEGRPGDGATFYFSLPCEDERQT